MEIPFNEYSARVQKHLENIYGVRVVTRDIPDPLTGDLDGSEIDCFSWRTFLDTPSSGM